MSDENPSTSGTGRNRNATCSFCRQPYREVGPLVEGPNNVNICRTCAELCLQIFEQEAIRRGEQRDSSAPRSAE